jgi:hypothetical protein
VLPDGTVFVTNGANRDEVDLPGSGSPVMQTELVDPDAGTVTAGPSLAANHGRTYHNSAVLLPDGRVLIGGHAPIATGYSFQTDAGSAAGLSAPESDSSFQIYSPPYLSYGPRPKIQDVADRVGNNQSLEIATDGRVDKVVLVRDPSMTHLTDGDQRNVELRLTSQGGGLVRAFVPGSTVVPPGPYMLFVERAVTVGGATKLVPSVSRPVTVTGGGEQAVGAATPQLRHRGHTDAHQRQQGKRALAALAAPAEQAGTAAAVPGRLVPVARAGDELPSRREGTWVGAAGLAGLGLLALVGNRRRRRTR